MGRSFMPERESELLNWSRRFARSVTALAQQINVPASMAAELTARQAAFESAYRIALDPATRTIVAVSAKDTARDALRAIISAVARLAQNQPALDDETRLMLGLTVRRKWTRVATPAERPMVSIGDVRANRVAVVVTNEQSRRCRPGGVAGVEFLYAVGEQQPDMRAWRIIASTSRTSICLQFDASVPPGALVWIVARWFNPRQERGPLSFPACTRVMGFLGVTPATALRVAA